MDHFRASRTGLTNPGRPVQRDAGHAARAAHRDTARALLERGADVHRLNDRGQSALAAATFKQDTEVVRTLLAAGADPDEGNPSARATTQFFDLPEMAKLFE